MVVDDDPRIRELLRRYLSDNGFSVSTAENGAALNRLWQRERFDALILDLMLPGAYGLDILKTFRVDSDVPVLILSARNETEDKVRALKLGADDYVTKPFSPRELVARVRAVLRRVQGGVYQPGLIHAGDLEIDLHGHRVTRAGEPIKLTRSEFNLLATLAQHPGQTFTRAQLIDRLHGVVYDGFDRSIDAHIKNLRRKLEPNPVEPCYVLTVYGVGYKFTDEV